MGEAIGLEAFIKMDGFRAAVKEYNASVSKMNAETDSAATGITGKFQTMGNSILGIAAGLGKAMVAGATAAAGAMAAFVGSGVKLATDLEDQMAGVRAILGVTAADLEIIRQKTVELGLNPNLKVSAVEAAGAIEMLARNGLGMQEILDGAAESTILLANATGADFSNAANIATDAMAIFNIEAKDMLGAVDGISSVTTSSKFDINDYAFALAQGGGAASAAGVEFNDFNTAIAAISPLFKAGSDAGTSFKTFITRLVPSSTRAAEAMAALGIITQDGSNRFFDAQGNLRSMAEIAGVLQETLAGLSEEQRTQALSTIFGADAMRAAVGLMNTGEEGFQSLQQTMSETSALEQAKIRVDTLAGALDIFAGIIEAVKLQVGDAFIPLIRQVVEGLSSFVEANQEKIVGFFQNVATFISTFVGALQDGAGPVGAFLSALSAAGVDDGIVTKISDFVDRARALIDVVREFVNDHAEALKGAIIGIGAALATAAIAAAITGIVTAFASGFGPIILIAGLLGAVIAHNWDAIQGAITEAWATIKPALDGIIEVLGDLWGEIKPGAKILGQFAKQIVDAFKGGGIKGAIKEFVGLWPAIKTVITATVTNVLGFIGSKFGVDLVGIFNRVRAVVSTVWTVISGIFNSAAAVIGPTVQNLFSGIGDAFGSFAPLGETFKHLWETLQPVISTAAAIIGGVLLGLVGIVVGVFNGIVAAIQPLITTLGFVLNGVITFVDGVIEFFTGLVQFIGALFTGNSEKMQEAWATMGAGITNVVLGLVETVSGLFVGLWETLKTLIGGLVDGVVGFFTNLYNTLVGNSIIPDLVNAVIAWVVNLKDNFISLVVGLVLNVVNKFIELKTAAVERVQALKTAVVTLFEALKTAVSDKVELLKIAATNKFNLIKTAVIEKLQELKDRAIEKVLLIKDGILDKFEELKNLLGNKVDKFREIGSSLIEGIKDGIMSGVAALVAAVEGVIDLLPAAAKDLLGIASPSKLFYGFGVNVIRGLINGVNFMRSAAAAAMSNVIGTLPGVNLDVNASNIARGSSNAGVAAARPSVVQLDPSSLRGLGGSGDTYHQYYLNNTSGGSQLGVRQAFRLMELSRS